MIKNVSWWEIGNRCGPNSTLMCNHIRRHLYKIYHELEILDNGIYFMFWGMPSVSEETTLILNTHYGSVCGTINVSYHAIPYIVVRLKDRIFYVAIESTYRYTNRYKMQFFVALDEETLFNLLKLRYQYKKIVKSNDCDFNNWQKYR